MEHALEVKSLRGWNTIVSPHLPGKRYEGNVTEAVCSCGRWSLMVPAFSLSDDEILCDIRASFQEHLRFDALFEKNLEKIMRLRTIHPGEGEYKSDIRHIP